MSLETIGWIGSICFAICGAPQAYMSYKDKHSDGVSSGFLSLWIAGEIFTLIYIWPKQDWPIISNLLWNLLFIGIIVRYKICPSTKP